MSCSEILRNGGVAVMATDTIYGVVAAAQNEAAVARLYALKGRAPEKPCIILIASADDIALFGAEPTPAQRAVLDASWPGPVTFILPVDASVPEYLHRGTHTLAFRLPADEKLRTFLSQTGPLSAPSANPEGQPPARTIEEARAYFGDGVDCYQDAGPREGKPSRLIRLAEDGSYTVLRT